MQLMLFGFAINDNPKHLTTIVTHSENSPFERKILSVLNSTNYFDIQPNQMSESAADERMRQSVAQFIVTFPSSFTKKVLRGESPTILVKSDGANPMNAGRAISILEHLTVDVLTPDLKGLPNFKTKNTQPFKTIIHNAYNPMRITAYSIVPGLLGVVLTITMVVITSLALVKEREFGTIENLLSTPIRPSELIIGKIFPYILVGYIQVLIILSVSYLLFHIPVQGSIGLLLCMCLPFIAANLSVGITFSTLSDNQFQASQLASFFFLPSILLSGFMFPFQAMPFWAQCIGNCLPLTHFLVIVRGILLKGNSFTEVIGDIFPILLFTLAVMMISLNRYKKTLD
jgi:ABC-2 type transport system permease protein